MLESLDFSPLFAGERILIIKRPTWLEKGNSKSKTSGFDDVLKNYITEPPVGQTLIITAINPVSGNPVAKLLNKQAQVIACAAPDVKYLLKWIKEEFANRRQPIAANAVKFLAACGQDMYYIWNCIEKLSLVWPEKEITEVDIKDMIDTREEIKIFKLLDSLAARDSQAALKAWSQLLEQGEPPVRCLYMIAKHFAGLSEVKYYLGQGASRQEIEAVTGLQSFRVTKLMRGARNFSDREIKALFPVFLDADIRLKTGGFFDQTTIETLIITICSRKL